MTVDRRPGRARAEQPQVQQRPPRPPLWIFLGSEELAGPFLSLSTNSACGLRTPNTSRAGSAATDQDIGRKPMVKADESMEACAPSSEKPEALVRNKGEQHSAPSFPLLCTSSCSVSWRSAQASCPSVCD